MEGTGFYVCVNKETENVLNLNIRDSPVLYKTYLINRKI